MHLREQQVWVCWCWFWDGKKWTKPPYRADSPDRNASSSDPATWGTYERAIEQVRAGKADGIGVALKGRNLGGVDLDHCRDPKTRMIEPWAEERLQQFPGAYVEATVSGKGLRILGTSALEGFAPKFKLADKGNGAAIELFSNSNHYLTLSCNEITSCGALPDIGDKMAAIAAELGGKHNGFDFEPPAGSAGADQAPIRTTHDSTVVSSPRADHAPRADDAPHVAPETEPAPETGTPWSFAEETRLRSALNAIPTNETLLADKFGHAHDTWVKIGRAIERLDWGERGFAIFRDWSAQNAQEFNEHGLRTQWASFNRNRGAREKPTTIATVYLCAIKFGWRGDDAETITENADDALCTISAEEVEMCGVEWLWPDRFALGKIGLIAGLPDMGKGQIAAFIAGAVTAAIELPCDEGTAPQGGVIWFNAEDDARDTVKPRLIAAGADLKRVHFVNSARIDGEDKSFSLVTDLHLLRKR